MIKIDWERFFGYHIFFGFYYRWVWVTDGSFDETKWLYSGSWMDRLWPLRDTRNKHPEWWIKGITWIIKAIKLKSTQTVH